MARYHRHNDLVFARSKYRPNGFVSKRVLFLHRIHVAATLADFRGSSDRDYSVNGSHEEAPTSFYDDDHGDGPAGFRRRIFLIAASLDHSQHVGSGNKPGL